MPDSSGCPTEAEIERVRMWSYEDGYAALMEYVKGLWWSAERGFVQQGRKYYVSTGGWSGNEEIIDALRENEMFWVLCWESSQRGGHYVFRLPQRDR